MPKSASIASPFLEQDVLRLDVAMHELLAVRVVERARHLLRDRERLLDAELVLAIQLVAQRLAAHERQHVVEEAVRLARIDQREDVRMIEPRRDLDLGEEALGAEHRAELGAEDLEGDLAIELAIAGEVDDGHAAGAELALDDVAVVECGCDEDGGGVAHAGECGGRVAGGEGCVRSSRPRVPSGDVAYCRMTVSLTPLDLHLDQYLAPVQTG